MTTWLSNSKQGWKLIPSCALALMSLLLLVRFVTIETEARRQNPWMAVGFAVCSVASLAWLFWSVRCPRCDGHVAWWIVNHAPAGSWLTQLNELQRCPICGSEGANRE